MQTLLTFLIVFGVLVLVHEFGHFYFAKRSGILVREFAIGMGPKIYSHQGKDGTTYTIRILPVGGYVRMAGMDDEDTELKPGMPLAVELDQNGLVKRINTDSKIQLQNSIPMELLSADLEDKLTISGYVQGDESQAVSYPVHHDATIIEPTGTEIRIAPRDVQFQSAKLSHRMMTNFAGPMNNFILAAVLFIVLAFMQGGVPDYDTNKIGTVQAGSPAAEAGLKADDEIQSVNGKNIASWYDMTELIQKNPDKELTIAVKRGDVTKEIKVTPESEDTNGEKVGKLGVGVYMKTGIGDKITGGLKQTWTMGTQLFKALGSLIMKPDINKLGGPVMMYQMSSEAAQQGLTSVIALMAFLSVNLGMVNLFPIPAFDGGKLVLNMLEGVRGKPLSREKEGMITLIGVGFIVLLMIMVTWNDLQRFFMR